jgi:hypothetical protein
MAVLEVRDSVSGRRVEAVRVEEAVVGAIEGRGGLVSIVS